MIGFYNYTMVLTYLSLLSAGLGIFVSLSENGHPYIGVFFLLFCGLCDAFDGKVARTKKDRTDLECRFGIQIDSLSDLVAFGVLPAVIGTAILRNSPILLGLRNTDRITGLLWTVILFAIPTLYILAALIRLAYFNVTEEERQATEDCPRKSYTGLPVTSASLVFPAVMMLRYTVPFDASPLYFFVLILMGFAFLSKIRVPKPGLRGILIMIGIGVLETVATVLLRIYFR